MLKIGIIGAGHLGKIHIKCISEIPEFKLVGFFDTDPSIVQKVSNEFGIRSFSSADELISEVDVVDIVTPTNSHFEYAAIVLKNFRHLFIEKPVAATPEEALKLIEIAREAHVKVQVGHVERYNPAMVAALPFIHNPMMIEMQRLTNYSARGTDVPVVLDLMVHDIDLVLYTVQANLRKISANGVAVMTKKADIVNARLEFDNGCVANLTASRLSPTPVRKARFFQQDSYISVDFLTRKTEITHLELLNKNSIRNRPPILDSRNENDKKQIHIEIPEIKPANAIKSEFTSFARSIIVDTTPDVTLYDGYLALKVAHQILEKIEYSIAL